MFSHLKLVLVSSSSAVHLIQRLMCTVHHYGWEVILELFTVYLIASVFFTEYDSVSIPL